MTTEPGTRANLIDPAHFREVLGHFCSGITVLAAHVGGRPVGMTCQSFFSVSIAPPLIAVCVGRDSTTYPLIRSAGGFVVNVLDSSQHAISSAFARSGTDKWAGVAWSPGETAGHPVIDGVHAAMECHAENELAAGDHFLVIARVQRLWAQPEGDPLLFYRGSYHQLHRPTRFA